MQGVYGSGNRHGNRDRIRDGRNDHNRECVELWLLTKAHKLSTRPPAHPDEFHGFAGKRGSSPNQDATWLEAISTPDCRRTNNYLTGVLKDMERWEPDARAVLQTVYVGNAADESLPEQWKAQIAKGKHVTRNRILLHLIEDAFVFILYRLYRDGEILYWPSPDEAHSYAAREEGKKRLGLKAWGDAIDDGRTPTEALQLAMRRSGAKERTVRYWIVGRPATATKAKGKVPPTEIIAKRPARKASAPELPKESRREPHAEPIRDRAAGGENAERGIEPDVKLG